jgi:hypothetical protein
LGVVEKDENEEETLGIQKREASGDWKSGTSIEMRTMAMETTEGTGEDLHRARKRGQKWV